VVMVVKELVAVNVFGDVLRRSKQSLKALALPIMTNSENVKALTTRTLTHGTHLKCVSLLTSLTIVA
jgi:hypothetical protein